MCEKLLTKLIRQSNFFLKIIILMKIKQDKKNRGHHFIQQ